MKNKYIGCCCSTYPTDITLYYIEADNELNAYKKLLTNQKCFSSVITMISEEITNKEYVTTTLVEYNDIIFNKVLNAKDINSIKEYMSELNDIIDLSDKMLYFEIFDLNNIIKSSFAEKSLYIEADNVKLHTIL